MRVRMLLMGAVLLAAWPRASQADPAATVVAMPTEAAEVRYLTGLCAKAQEHARLQDVNYERAKQLAGAGDHRGAIAASTDSEAHYRLALETLADLHAAEAAARAKHGRVPKGYVEKCEMPTGAETAALP